MKLKYLVLLVLFVANFSFSQESPPDASNPLGKDSSATVISPKPVVMKVTIGGTDSDLVQGNGEAIDSKAPEQISNKPNDVQQVKVEILPNSISVTDISVKREMKDGNRTVFDYGEIRGISGTVRSILIKDGYKVVQGKPAVGGVSQGDEFFDILDRAK